MIIIVQNRTEVLSRITKINKRLKGDAIRVVSEEAGLYYYHLCREQRGCDMKEWLELRQVRGDNVKSVGNARLYKLYRMELENTFSTLGIWSVVGRIEHSHAGNLLHGTNEANGNTLLGWKDATACCQHCRTKRQRNDTYVLHNAELGYKQIGRSCLKEFTGFDASAITSAMKSFIDICDYADEERERMSGGCNFLMPVRIFIAAAMAAIRERDGFKPVSEGESSTQSRAIRLTERCSPGISEQEEKENSVNWKRSVAAYWANLDGTEVDTIVEAIAAKKDSGNSFDYNAGLLAVDGTFAPFGSNHSAVLAAAVHKVLQTIDAPKAGKLNEHVGATGDKIKVRVVVTKIRAVHGQFGTSHWVNMQDAEGRCYSWCASRCPEPVERGVEMEIAGTIKAHELFNERKITVLTRCKVNTQVAALAAA